MNKIGFTPPLPDKALEKQSEGDKPHVLSRLDYLVLHLNSYGSGVLPFGDNSIRVHFVKVSDHDTIVILITHLPNTPQQHLDVALKHSQQFVDYIIKSLGWDWVKIEHEISPIFF